MKKFNEFNIELKQDYLVGDKVKIDKILNREIVVEAYKITDSKYEGKGLCLHLQFSLNGTQSVCFGSFSRLIEQIKQVPELPFETTIVKENNVIKFT